MTEESITAICEETECFKTPNLNHQLLLHRRGFRKIENLDAYVNVKTLFLEGNSISKIENLYPLEHLRALYLQENCIGRELGLENLAQVPLIIVLNLEGNGIKTLKGFPRMGSLETLQLRNNQIEDITPILQSLRLTTLDISCNAISDVGVLDQLGELEDLKVLYMKGNPLIETTSFYRKRALATLHHVTFLDDRPVFPNEQRLSQAWLRGGRKEEDKEREAIQLEHEVHGNVKHYIMEDDDQFSERSDDDIIVGGVEWSTIPGRHSENLPDKEEIVTELDKENKPGNKTEGGEETLVKEKCLPIPTNDKGKAELRVSEGRWTETLDQLLTMNVSAYQHDFEQVADHMKMVAVSEMFDPEFYSQEECKRRWEYVDSSMRDDTWGFPEAAEACTEELRTAEANRSNEQR